KICSGSPCCRWSDWGRCEASGRCSSTCGTGKKYGTRTRTKQIGLGDSSRCNGPSIKPCYTLCENPPCGCKWSNWGQCKASGRCSSTCGPGKRYGTRTRTKQMVLGGPPDCIGASSQTCYTPCDNPPNGCRWSNWGQCKATGRCSSTCGPGQRYGIRTRTKQNVPGWCSKCIGASSETCYTPCDNPSYGCRWSNWGQCKATGRCSSTCGPGQRYGIRTRTKQNVPGCSKCIGASSETCYATCNKLPCGCRWSDWGQCQASGRCSSTCGPGKKYGTRTRTKQIVLGGQPVCVGTSSETC
ncbi:unnamed protein product, partial [Owenia fusiformis]